MTTEPKQIFKAKKNHNLFPPLKPIPPKIESQSKVFGT